MKAFETLKVMYHGRLVGQLTMGTNDTCLFQYDREWLNTGFSISPLKLPLRGDLFEADYLPFEGNFGVFEMSRSLCSNIIDEVKPIGLQLVEMLQEKNYSLAKENKP